MAGHIFDAWRFGDRIAHEIHRTVTETDNLLFSTMTHNPRPLQLHAEAANASECGRILLNGTFTCALMVGLSVGDTTLRTRTVLRSLLFVPGGPPEPWPRCRRAAPMP